MPESYIFENTTVVDAHGSRPVAAFAINGPQLGAAGSTATRIAAHDLVLTPGFVDVHTHGGGNFNLHTTDPAEILAYARWAPSTGTTAFLAGVVGVPHGLPEAQIKAVQAAMADQPVGAEIAGIHLEGPFISPQRRGAHDPAWLRTPSDQQTTYLLELAGTALKLVTIAPELSGADEMIKTLAAAGITVSIGHTDANYAQAQAAIPLGITHATHCFNAMPPLLHREPGPLGAIAEADAVRGELIADGVHVHPAALRIMLRALGPDRAVIVTDALACAGLAEATFTFAGQQARVVDGVARLADGTITGSVLTMDQALRNVVRFADVPLPAAVAMLSLNPARSAGIADRKGLLQPGYDADVLVFDQNLALLATFCRGVLAATTPAWQTRLNQNA